MKTSQNSPSSVPQTVNSRKPVINWLCTLNGQSIVVVVVLITWALAKGNDRMATNSHELIAQNLEHFLITNPSARARVPITIPSEGERFVATTETADVYILADHEGPCEGPFEAAEHYLVSLKVAQKYPSLTLLVRLHLASSRYRGTILVPEFLDTEMPSPRAASIGSLLTDYAGTNICLSRDPRKFGLAAEFATGWVIGLQPPLPMAEAVQSAFKDRFITSEDHSVLQKWKRF